MTEPQYVGEYDYNRQDRPFRGRNEGFRRELDEEGGKSGMLGVVRPTLGLQREYEDKAARGPSKSGERDDSSDRGRGYIAHDIYTSQSNDSRGSQLDQNIWRVDMEGRSQTYPPRGLEPTLESRLSSQQSAARDRETGYYADNRSPFSDKSLENPVRLSDNFGSSRGIIGDTRSSWLKDGTVENYPRSILKSGVMGEKRPIKTENDEPMDKLGRDYQDVGVDVDAGIEKGRDNRFSIDTRPNTGNYNDGGFNTSNQNCYSQSTEKGFAKLISNILSQDKGQQSISESAWGRGYYENNNSTNIHGRSSAESGMEKYGRSSLEGSEGRGFSAETAAIEKERLLSLERNLQQPQQKRARSRSPVGSQSWQSVGTKLLDNPGQTFLPSSDPLTQALARNVDMGHLLTSLLSLAQQQNTSLNQTQSGSPQMRKTRPESPQIRQTRPESPQIRQTRPESPQMRQTRPGSPPVRQTHSRSPPIRQTRSKSPPISQTPSWGSKGTASTGMGLSDLMALKSAAMEMQTSLQRKQHESKKQPETITDTRKPSSLLNLLSSYNSEGEESAQISDAPRSILKKEPTVGAARPARKDPEGDKTSLEGVLTELLKIFVESDEESDSNLAAQTQNKSDAKIYDKKSLVDAPKRDEPMSNIPDSWQHGQQFKSSSDVAKANQNILSLPPSNLIHLTQAHKRSGFPRNLALNTGSDKEASINTRASELNKAPPEEVPTTKTKTQYSKTLKLPSPDRSRVSRQPISFGIKTVQKDPVLLNPTDVKLSRGRSRGKSPDKKTSGNKEEKSRSRSPKKPRDRKISRSESRERGKSRSRSKGRKRSKSRSRSRGRKRSRSRSRSRGRKRSKTRSRSRGRKRSKTRSRSRGRKRSKTRSRSRGKQTSKSRSPSRGKIITKSRGRSPRRKSLSPGKKKQRASSRSPPPPAKTDSKASVAKPDNKGSVAVTKSPPSAQTDDKPSGAMSSEMQQNVIQLKSLLDKLDQREKLLKLTASVQLLPEEGYEKLKSLKSDVDTRMLAMIEELEDIVQKQIKLAKTKDGIRQPAYTELVSREDDVNRRMEKLKLVAANVNAHLTDQDALRTLLNQQQQSVEQNKDVKKEEKRSPSKGKSEDISKSRHSERSKSRGRSRDRERSKMAEEERKEKEIMQKELERLKENEEKLQREKEERLRKEKVNEERLRKEKEEKLRKEEENERLRREKENEEKLRREKEKVERYRKEKEAEEKLRKEKQKLQAIEPLPPSRWDRLEKKDKPAEEDKKDRRSYEKDKVDRRSSNDRDKDDTHSRREKEIEEWRARRDKEKEKSTPRSRYDKDEKSTLSRREGPDDDIQVVGSVSTTYKILDLGKHWCRPCGFVYNTLSEFVTHLKNSNHSKLDEEKPWLKHKCEEDEKSEPAGDARKAVRVNLKGTEFLSPCEGYYCSLCKLYLPHTRSLEDHALGQKHNLAYMKFVKENPRYEKSRQMKKVIQDAITQVKSPQVPPAGTRMTEHRGHTLKDQLDYMMTQVNTIPLPAKEDASKKGKDQKPWGAGLEEPNIALVGEPDSKVPQTKEDELLKRPIMQIKLKSFGKIPGHKASPVSQQSRIVMDESKPGLPSIRKQMEDEKKLQDVIKQEEFRKQQEELKKQQEWKKKDDEIKKQQAEIRKQQEDIWKQQVKQQEEWRRKEEEMRQLEEWRKNQDEFNRQQKEWKKQQEEIMNNQASNSAAAAPLNAGFIATPSVAAISSGMTQQEVLQLDELKKQQQEWKKRQDDIKKQQEEIKKLEEWKEKQEEIKKNPASNSAAALRNADFITSTSVSASCSEMTSLYVPPESVVHIPVPPSSSNVTHIPFPIVTKKQDVTRVEPKVASSKVPCEMEGELYDLILLGIEESDLTPMVLVKPPPPKGKPDEKNTDFSKSWNSQSNKAVELKQPKKDKEKHETQKTAVSSDPALSRNAVLYQEPLTYETPSISQAQMGSLSDAPLTFKTPQMLNPDAPLWFSGQPPPPIIPGGDQFPTSGPQGAFPGPFLYPPGFVPESGGSFQGMPPTGFFGPPAPGCDIPPPFDREIGPPPFDLPDRISGPFHGLPPPGFFGRDIPPPPFDREMGPPFGRHGPPPFDRNMYSHRFASRRHGSYGNERPPPFDNSRSRYDDLRQDREGNMLSWTRYKWSPETKRKWEERETYLKKRKEIVKMTQRSSKGEKKEGDKSKHREDTEDRRSKSQRSSDKSRGSSDKSRGSSDKSRVSSDKSRGSSDKSRGSSDKSRGSSDKSRGSSDKSREVSEKKDERKSSSSRESRLNEKASGRTTSRGKSEVTVKEAKPKEKTAGKFEGEKTELSLNTTEQEETLAERICRNEKRIMYVQERRERMKLVLRWASKKPQQQEDEIQESTLEQRREQLQDEEINRVNTSPVKSARKDMKLGLGCETGDVNTVPVNTEPGPLKQRVEVKKEDEKTLPIQNLEKELKKDDVNISSPIKPEQKDLKREKGEKNKNQKTIPMESVQKGLKQEAREKNVDPKTWPIKNVRKNSPQEADEKVKESQEARCEPVGDETKHTERMLPDPVEGGDSNPSTHAPERKSPRASRGRGRNMSRCSGRGRGHGARTAGSDTTDVMTTSQDS